MPAPFADLEIRLSPHPSGQYGVGLRFSRSDIPELLETEVEAPVSFDFDALNAAEGKPEYGSLLTKMLFSATVLREKLAEAETIADGLETPLRVRLYISRGAPRLDALRWETLRHPRDDTPLASSERVLFSRYLSSADWGSVRRQARGELSALVAIANPINNVGTGPGLYPLYPIDVDGELERAQTSLGSKIPTTNVLPPMTIDTLTENVRKHKPDLLYLVCHGGRSEGDDVPILYFEDQDRAVQVVTAAELAEQLDILEQRLQVVVLASCRSSGGDVVEGSNGALAALGPLLAAAGVPAVVAMQGDVTMGTVKQFMPKFFTELREHGEIDRAMARARNLVREHHDAWMPVLFLRLKSGLWYEAGFAGGKDGFKKWLSLKTAIENGQCVPILGSGLTDGVFGSRREIARHWAEAYHFPLAPHDRDDLPQVAQFLTVTQGWAATISTLEKQVKAGLLAPLPRRAAARADRRRRDVERHFGGGGQATAREQRNRAASGAGKSAVAHLRHHQSGQPHAGCAARSRQGAARRALPLELRPGHRLAAIAVRQGERHLRPRISALEEEPLVYHLFGNLDYPDTLVLTEDQYFDFLKRAGDAVKVREGSTPDPNNFRTDVLAALAKSALLFVGFQMDDWDFRMLFRSDVIYREGNRARRYFNVGVQVSPEEGRYLEVEAASDYLDTYLNAESANISIFWGNGEDFVAALAHQLADSDGDGAQ